MIVRCALALVVGTGCFFKPGPPSGSGSDDAAVDDGAMSDGGPVPWLDGYMRRRRITITRAPGTETLLDFPVSVILENDADLVGHVSSELDMVFTDASGQSKLDYEIRDYNPTLGTLEAWVRIPSLPMGMTDFYLYYGGAAGGQDGGAVWANAYGVWHMDSDTEEKDVTAHVSSLTAPPGSMPERATGVVGRARKYRGGDSLCVSQTNVLPVGSQAFSFSLWVQQTDVSTGDDSPLWRGGDGNTPGFAVGLGSVWSARVHDGLNPGSVSLGNPSTSWTHIAVSVDNPNNILSATVNGQSSSSFVPNLGSLGTSNTFCIGDVQVPFTGHIDEVRVWSKLCSVAWFQAEHTNVAMRSSFMSVAAAEAR